MALLYLLFLVSLIIIILDIQSTPADKKLTSWNKGRPKNGAGMLDNVAGKFGSNNLSIGSLD